MVKKQMRTLSKELLESINKHHLLCQEEHKIYQSIYVKLDEIDKRIIEKYNLRPNELDEIDKRIIEKYNLRPNEHDEYCANWEGDFSLNYTGNLSIREINEIRSILNCTNFKQVQDDSGYFYYYCFEFSFKDLYKKDFETGEWLRR